MAEFDTLFTALNSYLSDFKNRELYYDCYKRKIVNYKPVHLEYITLVTENDSKAVFEDMLEKLVNYHLNIYHRKIIERATKDAISYDELLIFLEQECEIFYDAAIEIQKRIFDCPQEYGLQKIMHYSKSLAFIPMRRKIAIKSCLTV